MSWAGALHRFALWGGIVPEPEAKRLPDQEREPPPKRIKAFVISVVAYLCLGGILSFIALICACK